MESLYAPTLLIHSALRYALIILASVAIYKAWTGWLSNKPYTAADNKISVFLIATVHLQLVIGLLMYFFMSPYVKQGLSNMKEAMSQSLIRYWTVEHIFVMIIVVVLFQLGRTLSKKASADKSKHQRAAIFYTIAFLLAFIMSPWPFYNGLAYFGEFARSSYLTLF